MVRMFDSLTKKTNNSKNFSFQSKSRKAKSLPLVLGAPLDPEEGTTIIIGIPPLNLDDERKK